MLHQTFFYTSVDFRESQLDETGADWRIDNAGEQ